MTDLLSSSKFCVGLVIACLWFKSCVGGVELISAATLRRDYEGLICIMLSGIMSVPGERAVF